MAHYRSLCRMPSEMTANTEAAAELLNKGLAGEGVFGLRPGPKAAAAAAASADAAADASADADAGFTNAGDCAPWGVNNASRASYASRASGGSNGGGSNGGGSIGSGGSIGMDHKQQEAVARQFRSGEINVLVGTTVVEEGLDVQVVVTLMFAANLYAQSRSVICNFL